MGKTKKETVLDGHKLDPFDVKPLVTNVPVEKTIDITLERIYNRKEINTQVTRPDMKELLTFPPKMYILSSMIRFINKTMERQ